MEPDDVSKDSDESSILILAQQDTRSSINPNYLLLDSQSTINLFSNPTHVTNVHPASRLVNVHCNSGVMPTGQVANFSKNEVYVNKDGIANILSLYLLGKSTASHMIAQTMRAYSRCKPPMASSNFFPLPTAYTSLILPRHPKLPIYLSHSLPHLYPMDTFT
jgi:hypothetical protein